jgi:hypothetical protein
MGQEWPKNQSPSCLTQTINFANLSNVLEQIQYLVVVVVIVHHVVDGVVLD